MARRSGRSARRLGLCGAATALVLAGIALSRAGSGAGAGAGSGEGVDASPWRARFARPAQVPAPPENPLTPEKVALGRALFEDPRLSGDGTLSCASCHQPLLSFTDGIARRLGHDGEPLPRRTPSLWNMAWGLTFFWDGRAQSLEDQASGPIENAREMGGDIAKATALLAADPAMTKGFAGAFPEDPRVTEANLRAALASFQRTLVSAVTRFDRWIGGDSGALTAEEAGGFRLFVGKAGCVNCHTGWRFTDEAFHDIGLPSTDRGRGEVLGLTAADRAFKTPSLRERAWTAPYMHDGSLKTFEEVVDHYADRIVARPTLSADLPRGLRLSDEERGQLVAFLATLSSDDPPRPQSLPAGVQRLGAEVPAVSATLVRERDRRFTPAAVALAAGQALTIVNDDTRTHNVRVDHPRMSFSSDAQEPGDKVVLSFGEPGTYGVICGIHPDMRLNVVVSSAEKGPTPPAGPMPPARP